MQTGDFKFIRNLNGQLVLNLIRKHGVISSSELVRMTGLRPSTIFNILKDLSEKLLINYLGKGDSTDKGGKKPYLWELNQEAAYVIGLDLEINSLTIVLLDLNGNLLKKNYVRFDKIKTEPQLIEIIIRNVKLFLDESNIDNEKILGMGIAVPAIVNSDTGMIIRTDVIATKNIALSKQLSNHYKFPILVENNANSTAVGSKWVGACKDYKNFIVVLIEFDRNIGGMGIGIVIDGHLYKGHSNCAGELNLPILNLDQMIIYIRNELSKSELLSKYDEDIDSLTVEALIDAANSGDYLATSVFKRLGHQIGEIIHNAISLLNPEALIVAGTIAELNEIITEPIKQVIHLRTLPFISETLQIKTTENGVNAVAIGAASLILNEFFKVPVLKSAQTLESISSGND